uniref:Transmembrane protein n=1 Tax=Compsopogon caeruleus TaxID=31354 RepID=A0A7S1TE76_9RHOD
MGMFRWHEETDEGHCPGRQEPTQEEAHGLAGRILHRTGPAGYLVFLLVPLAYVGIFLATIPLGDPEAKNFRSQAVFVLVTNPVIMSAISYLYASTYYGFHERVRPFHQSLGAPITVYLAEVVVMTPIYVTLGAFELAIFVSYVVAVIGTYFFLILAGEPQPKVRSMFLRFQVPLILFTAAAASYTIAYREASPAGQGGLVIALAFLTFIVRRVSLSLYDPYPLDIATLVAGLWFQNISDLFQTLAFPQVASPKVFAAIWVANSFGNISLLGFLTKAWIFTLRPWLKSHVLGWFKCDFSTPEPPVFDFSYDFNDRGHGPNVGGYRRRQFRFFFWRLISQASAQILYLCISPMLRFGLNDEHFPLSGIGVEEYRNSMIYAASYLIFVLLVGIMGYRYLKTRYPVTFEDMKSIHGHEFLHHTFVGFVVSILTHNLILAIAILASHYCTFSAFRRDQCAY